MTCPRLVWSGSVRYPSEGRCYVPPLQAYYLGDACLVFNALDQDRSGALSRDELLDVCRASFDSIDGDGDGQVPPAHPADHRPTYRSHAPGGCLGRQLLGLRGHPREERLFTPHAVSRLRRRSSRRRAATSCCAMRTRTGTGHHPASMPRLGMALLRAASEPPIVRTSLVGSSTFSSTWLGGTGRSEAPPGPASRVSTNDRVGAGLHGCRLRGSPPPPATLVSDVLVQAPVAGGARRSSSRRRSRRRPRRYLLRALLRPQACSRRDFGSCSQGFSRPWPARSCPCASAARVPPDATTQLGRHGSDRAVVAMAAAAAAMVMAAG